MGKNNKKRKLNAAPDTLPKQQNGSKSAPKSTGTASKPLPPTIPLQAEDRILLVGEGDFSFAKSIVEHHGCYEVIATCLDSQEELFEKYKPQAEAHVKYLEDEGQVVLYNVNATNLEHDREIKKQGGQFDVVLFNFPHVGGKSKDVNRQVRFNQELLVKFFAAALLILAPSGTIVVTLFEGEPYTLWNIRDLGRHSGLEVQRTFKFQPEAYPGYSHARTLGNIDGGGGWKGEDRESKSYIFQKKGTTSTPTARPRKPSGGKRKRPRERERESSDEEG